MSRSAYGAVGTVISTRIRLPTWRRGPRGNYANMVIREMKLTKQWQPTTASRAAGFHRVLTART